MKFTISVMGLLASTGIVAAHPGNGWGNKGHTTSSCWTSSTCKATYWTESTAKTTPVTVTSTKTIYKPVKETTEVASTYVSTAYGMLLSLIPFAYYTNNLQSPKLSP